MDTDTHELNHRLNLVLRAKEQLLANSDLLDNIDIAVIVNKLVAFSNSHIVAFSIDDLQVAKSLRDELDSYLHSQGIV